MQRVVVDLRVKLRRAGFDDCAGVCYEEVEMGVESGDDLIVEWGVGGET